MTSLRDFEDANLEGLAAFERWRAEYEAALVGPVAEEAIAEVLRMLTGDQVQQLKQGNPELWDRLQKRMVAR